jgi:hypothetical protein
MQTLGLDTSDSRSDGRLKSLFWPSVRSDMDVDYLTTQGFWICFVVSLATLALSVISGAFFGILDALFFYLGGNGVRRRSMVAAVGVFVVYAASTFLIARDGYAAGGMWLIVRIVVCALLLANVRAIWIASRWRSSGSLDESPVPLTDTFGDKLCDLFPAIVWPKLRLTFYVCAVLEVAGLAWVLLRVRGR